MTEEEKGAITEALDTLLEARNDAISNARKNPTSKKWQKAERFREAHANLQAFVDEAKNYEKDYGVSQYNFREFVEIVTEALRGIEG